jgi:hypothetical protein|tara:strand:+ start:421 stop:669 length:249 start_codon:yes stop_codon:yes gene_type:complete
MTTLAYKIEIVVRPMNWFSLPSLSFDKVQKINNPMNIKPKLLRALTGSLKMPELTLSHQREISPIDSWGSRVVMRPALPKIK